MNKTKQKVNMMESGNPDKAWTLAEEWAALASNIRHWECELGLLLFSEGVRDRHDADGDRLGDSPEASMVRVHARAALGALWHLSASLNTLANMIDNRKEV